MQLPKCAYNVQPGLFGLIRYTRNQWHEFKPVYIEWYYCRDSFQYAWRRHTRHSYADDSFFFCCHGGRIAAFLLCVERELGLWKKSKVYSTHTKGICNICPAQFWLSQEIRMSLFTILLRAAERYKPGSDWKGCLFSNPSYYQP